MFKPTFKQLGSSLFTLALTFGTLANLPNFNEVAKADTSTPSTFTPYTLVNGDYEQPVTAGNQIPGWGTYLGTPSSTVSIDTRAHAGNASMNLTNGFIAAWNVLNVDPGNENAPHTGDVVQASVWVDVPDTSTDLSSPFNVWVEEVDSSGHKHRIAQAAIPPNLPRNQWVQLTTSPVDGGVIQSSSTQLVVSYQDSVMGTVLVDDLQMGCVERGVQPPAPAVAPVMYGMNNSSFESNLASSWGTYTSLSTVSTSTDAYYGKQSLQLENTSDPNSFTSVWQTIPTGTSSEQPKSGDAVEAGAWVKLLPDATPVSGAALKLQVDGVDAQGNKVVLAQSKDLSSLPKGVWTYVLTQPISGQTVSNSMNGIVVSIQDGLKGGVLFDLVQAGQQNALTGNPQKFVIGEYQPWYGGPGRWHNWQWTAAGTPHVPDNILPNGQRDIAAFYYPLIGAYDSTNPAVLQYHVDLMKAMGIDCILVDWYANLEPDYVKTFNELVDIADKSDMKVAVFYEPKMYFAGWIPTNTRQEKINGITKDITDYIDQYKNHKSILQVRGRPVVGIFGATDTGLSSSDWGNILQTIHSEGYNPYMIGDIAANDPPSSFDGMMNWILYSSQLAADNSYNTVESFSENINQGAAKWETGDPVHRLGIGVVWPGFNDSAVDGWGGGSRVIQESPDVYNATWDGMLKQNFNWAVIATFNDFNESTAIEPSVQLGDSRAITTSKYIAQFKGTQPVDPSAFKNILKQYLENAVPQFSKDGSIDNQGIANALLQKLQDNDLEDFVALARAQSGKHINQVVASDLVRDGEWILNQ